MRSFLFCLLIGLTFAQTTTAQPLADKVPAKPLLYVGWRGSDDLGSDYAGSHLKAILDQSNIPAVFSDMIPRAVMRVSQANAQIGEIVRTVMSVAGPMWRHPGAIYLANIQVGQEIVPRAAILCKAGSDSAQLLARLQTLIHQLGKTPIPVRAFQSGDIVALTVGYAESEDAVALAAADSLQNDKEFLSAAANVQKDPVIELYLNFDGVWKLIDQAVAEKGPPEVQTYWPKIREASGLAGLKRLVMSSGFDGKDWMEQAFIEAPGPHTGLLTMLDSKPLDDSLFHLAPADCDMMMAGSFDFAKLIGSIRTSVAQVDPDAGQIVEKVLGAVSLYIGRDFQKDVLAALGEHWLYYSSPTIGGRGVLGAVIVNPLVDPKKAESGILSTQIAIFNTAAPFLFRYHLTLRTQTFKADDMSVNYIAMPLISPAWSIGGQNLYISLFPQNNITAARFARSGGKSMADNSSFNDLRKRLNAPKDLSGVGYMDLTQTIGEGYQGALAVSRLLLGAGDIFGVKSPEPVLPPLDLLLKHVGPSGSISYVDEKGWHSRAVSSFPGAELLGGGGGGAAQILMQAIQMFGVMSPSLFRARENAVAIADGAYLRDIGMACLMYSNDHKGAFPNSLDEITKYVKDDPRTFVLSQHEALASAARSLPPDQLADWVKQNSDYEYLGNGRKLSEITNAGTELLAYGKTPCTNGLIAVLFMDGHVEFAGSEKISQLIHPKD